MKLQIKTLIIGMFGAISLVSAQSSHSFLRNGDKNYEAQKYTEAEESYRRAIGKNPTEKGHFNLGNAIYQQSRFDEAIAKYQSAIQETDNAQIKADAYHNLGNAYFESQAFDKSIASYKEALKINPGDKSTQHNYALAKYYLQQQEQQQQNQQQQDQQDNQEQEDQKDQEQEPDQNNPNQQPSPSPNESEDQNEESEQRDNQLTKEEAEQLLKIAAEDEKKVQENQKKESAGKSKPKKDW